jgi:hypothetical protein
MADGYYHNGTNGAWQTLTASWNGTRWATVASPDPGTTGEYFLNGVSCPTARFCMADGYYDNGTPDQTLVLRWNGTRWAHASSPDSSTAEYNYLYAMSCTSATFCLTAGEYYNGTADQTLTEKW